MILAKPNDKGTFWMVSCKNQYLSQFERFKETASALGRDEDEAAFNERLRKMTVQKPKSRPNRLWRVDYAKAEHGFTLQPASGQEGSYFEIFETQEKVRKYAADRGFTQVGNDRDLWAEP